jgi:hypothetical protein
MSSRYPGELNLQEFVKMININQKKIFLGNPFNIEKKLVFCNKNVQNRKNHVTPHHIAKTKLVCSKML